MIEYHGGVNVELSARVSHVQQYLGLYVDQSFMTVHCTYLL